MRTAPLLLTLICSLMAGNVAAADASRVELDHGITFTLPQGWVIEDRDDSRKGEKGRLMVELACETAYCRDHSLETCNVTIFPRHRGDNDGEAFAALYSSPATRYSRLRAVRIATSDDAEFRRMLAPMTIGPRDWWVVETDARHNMKSGLFADTIIGGWRVRASCKTCETGEIRHRDAMDMLGTFRQDGG